MAIASMNRVLMTQHFCAGMREKESIIGDSKASFPTWTVDPLVGILLSSMNTNDGFYLFVCISIKIKYLNQNTFILIDMIYIVFVCQSLNRDTVSQSKFWLRYSMLIGRCDKLLPPELGWSQFCRAKSNMSFVMRKPVLPYANNNGADQPAHPHSLISTFVVCYLDSIISLVSIFEISSL